MTPSAVSGESPKLLTESMAAESAEYRSLVGTSVSSALMSSSASRPWCLQMLTVCSWRELGKLIGNLKQREK